MCINFYFFINYFCLYVKLKKKYLLISKEANSILKLLQVLMVLNYQAWVGGLGGNHVQFLLQNRLAEDLIRSKQIP